MAKVAISANGRGFATLQISSPPDGHHKPCYSLIQEGRLLIGQAKDEELRRLRAAEESALPAADDDRLAASFEGNLRLTVQDGRELDLTPDQVSPLIIGM